MSLIRKNKLESHELNIMFNLAQMVTDGVYATNTPMTKLVKSHPLTDIYLTLSRGVDMDDHFEYSTIADLISRSMIEGEELSTDMKAMFLTYLSELKLRFDLNINTDLLIIHLL